MYARAEKKKFEPAVASGLSAHRWAILTGLGLLVFVLLAFYFIYNYRSSQNGPFRDQYEGKIVDKWAQYIETDEGSRPAFRFMVEQKDGKRFPVAVSSEIYQRGEVGMKIKKTETGGIELSGAGQTSRHSGNGN